LAQAVVALSCSSPISCHKGLTMLGRLAQFLPLFPLAVVSSSAPAAICQNPGSFNASKLIRTGLTCEEQVLESLPGVYFLTFNCSADMGQTSNVWAIGHADECCVDGKMICDDNPHSEGVCMDPSQFLPDQLTAGGVPCGDQLWTASVGMGLIDWSAIDCDKDPGMAGVIASYGQQCCQDAMPRCAMPTLAKAHVKQGQLRR